MNRKYVRDVKQFSVIGTKRKGREEQIYTAQTTTKFVQTNYLYKYLYYIR